MSIRTRSAAAFVAVILAVSLTACATPATTGPTDPVGISATPTASSPAATAGPDEIEGIRVGEPFSSATAAIPEFATTPGCEWVGSAPRDGYSLVVQRETDGDDDAPVVLVAVSAPSDEAAAAGPITPEGIGIGSSVEDARAAYPDAVEIPGVGDRLYLKVPGDAGAALFLSYSDGGDVIWALTATSLQTPPYEPCA
ncbi:hypothetical protein ACFC3F_06465 [Microbacterium sp. NPDC055910]|uniref:hypothetical protein n=1 Tax=Microbacterium sp. NPDC055910 TaxID=3345659 RepID=UPI0035D92B49